MMQTANGRNALSKPETTVFLLARIGAAAMLLWALERHPYSYYMTLRLLICAVCAFGVWFSYRQNNPNSALLMLIGALLYNPLVPVHLDRSTWQVINIVTAAVLLTSPLVRSGGVKN